MTRKSLTTLGRCAIALAFSVAGLGLAAGSASANTVGPSAPVGCISLADSCVTVSMDITRVGTDALRAFSVTFTLTGLVLCDTPGNSIVESDYLDSYNGGVPTAFQILDNGGGSYTVDGAILGTTCGPTTGPGTLFDVTVKSAGTDGTGTIAISNVILRDCSNTNLTADPGPSADVTIDTVAPAAVTDVAAPQKKSSNDTDGTTEITVNFTAPGDEAATYVYRKGFGDYPEYDDGTGAVPTAPADTAAAAADDWVLTGVTGTGQVDEPATRDFWYYVVFTEDACGNFSAVSNLTGGTLNYHLGDVRPGAGDNAVTTLDISALGAAYGATLTYGGANNDLDVGPTTDYSVDARPLTDDVINFEDLVVFAINYEAVSAPRMAPTPAGELALYEPAIALELAQEGDFTVARLLLVDNPNHVKGIHAFLSLDGLEIVSAERGSLAASQAGPVFFETLEENGGVWVDLALLGRGLAFDGSGEIAVLTLAGDGSARLGDVDLRDRKNRPASRRPVDSDPPAPEQSTSVQATGLPSRVELSAARPNPFGNSTEIAFRLPASAEVSLTVHDVTGRLVRTLVDRTVGAGEMSVSWDGRTDGGDLAGAGIYFYTLRTGDHRETRKLLRVN